MRPASDRHREAPESHTQDEGYQAQPALPTETAPNDDFGLMTEDYDYEYDHSHNHNHNHSHENVDNHPSESHDPACLGHFAPDHLHHHHHHLHHHQPPPPHIHHHHHHHSMQPAEYTQPAYHPDDYDQDMSDSDGGAPLEPDHDHDHDHDLDLDHDLDHDLDLADLDFLPQILDVPEIPISPFLSDTEDDEDQEIHNYTYPYFHAHTSLGLPLTGLDQAAMDASDDDFFDGTELPLELVEAEPIFDTPVMLSNPSPTMLGSENLHMVDTLRTWVIRAGSTRSVASRFKAQKPDIYAVRDQATKGVHNIRYEDLRGDAWDLQGWDFAAMGTTRRHARDFRNFTYKNYVNKPSSDRWADDTPVPSNGNFFRFKQMTIRRDVRLAHFQLRSVLACPSRNYAYYSAGSGISRTNLHTGKTELVLAMSEFMGINAMISTLDANHDVLMAGTFNGEYRLQNLRSDNKKEFVEGQITRNVSGITNHIQIHKPRRTGGPVAAISSNDFYFRVMDLTTQKHTLETRYSDVLNCSALSPDGRLRVTVGDSLSSLIIDADTGKIVQQLDGHKDYGFACDWSGDGHTVATGNQDMAIKIWDARHWCDSSGRSTPLTTIRTELAGARGLRFSPVGSGPHVLVAAEEADYIHIFDADNFESKQTFDIFSEIGGVCFSNDGQDVNFLGADHHRGGILQMERCGHGPEPYFGRTRRRSHGATGWSNLQDNMIYVDEPYNRRATSRDEVLFF